MRPDDHSRLGQLTVDVRHAWRRTTSDRPTAAAAALLLAIGIGTCTAMFALVQALLLKPVPFPNPDRLAHLQMRSESEGYRTVSESVLTAWRRSGLFVSVEGYTSDRVMLDDPSGPRVIQAAVVTPGVLGVLGAVPVDGGLFNAAGNVAGAEGHVIISERLRRILGADRGRPGSRLRINEQTWILVGVLHSVFRFPTRDTDLWLSHNQQTDGPSLAALVRFHPDRPVSPVLDAATGVANAVDPATLGLRASRSPLAGNEFADSYKDALAVAASASGLVLLALCVNVSGVLLGRATSRRADVSIALALGATRIRLVRQGLIEAAIIGCIACVAGIVVALVLTAFARQIVPPSFLAGTLSPVTVDSTAISLSVGVSLLSMIAASLPSVVAFLGPKATGLQALTRRTESRPGRQFGRVLVTGELALVFALLAGATTLVASYRGMTTVELGVRVEGMTSLLISVDEPSERTQRIATVSTIGQVLGQLPGVVDVAFSLGDPLYPADTQSGTWSAEEGGEQKPLSVRVLRVDDSYFGAYEGGSWTTVW